MKPVAYNNYYLMIIDACRIEIFPKSRKKLKPSGGPVNASPIYRMDYRMMKGTKVQTLGARARAVAGACMVSC